MDSLQDKVAVVTGAASGIGRALADECARRGMNVVLADVDEAGLRAAEAQLAEGGNAVLAVVTNTAQEASVQALAAATLERFGAAHLLFNNAGLVGIGEAWDGPFSLWEQVVGVNLYGVAHGIRAFLPIMKDQGEGHIVNTASLAGLIAMPGMGPYNATKHAVVAISEGLFVEMNSLGLNIGVSVLCPGFVATNLMDNSLKFSRQDGVPTELGGQSLAGAMNDILRASIGDGTSPASIAVEVLDAVERGQLWILPAAEFDEAITERWRKVVARENPL